MHILITIAVDPMFQLLVLKKSNMESEKQKSSEIKDQL